MDDCHPYGKSSKCLEGFRGADLGVSFPVDKMIKCKHTPKLLPLSSSGRPTRRASVPCPCGTDWRRRPIGRNCPPPLREASARCCTVLRCCVELSRFTHCPAGGLTRESP